MRKENNHPEMCESCVPADNVKGAGKNWSLCGRLFFNIVAFNLKDPGK